MTKERRVVVTGLGALTPLGNSVQDFWNNAISGKSGAGPITHFNPEKFKTTFACEIKDFDPTIHLDRNEIKRSDTFTKYGIYAASEAWKDAGIDMDTEDPFDIGVIWGSGQGGMVTFEEEVINFTQGDFNPRFSPFFIPKLITNMCSGMVSMKFGLMGINYGTVSACATSNSAMMDAFNYIKWGKAKVFIAGGSEAPVTQASIAGFNSLKALSTRNEDPEAASRPFDVDRDGFVMGEGAGAVVLEEYEHAKARGAKIYAEMVGASMTADAYHMTAIHPEGKGAAKAMNNCLEEAGINAEDVHYLNTHATSTPVGDPGEITAVTTVFGEQPANLKISATKSMTGHLLGAAGAIEGILSIKAIENNIIPPTINTSTIDPAIPGAVDIVTGEAREAEVNVAMSNAFGFGGHNATVLFRKI